MQISVSCQVWVEPPGHRAHVVTLGPGPLPVSLSPHKAKLICAKLWISTARFSLSQHQGQSSLTPASNIHSKSLRINISRDLSDLWWPMMVCQIYLLKQAWNNLHDGSKIFLVKANIFHGIKIYLAYLNGWIWFRVYSKHNKSITKEST